MEWISDGWDIIKHASLLYKGDGYMLELLVISVLYMCFISSKSKTDRRLLIYTVISMTILFNPVVAVVLQRVALNMVYWRTLWILPIGLVVSYSMVRLISKFKKKFAKTVVSIICIMTIIISGKQITTSENFQRTENCYKIPNEVVEVADIILADSKGPAKVVAPDAISIWIREYSSEIKLLYGRGALYGYDEWTVQAGYLKYMLDREVFNMEELADAMQIWEYQYLVLEKNRINREQVMECGYVLLDDTREYNIFVRI